jgi:hypothetical protein
MNSIPQSLFVAVGIALGNTEGIGDRSGPIIDFESIEDLELSGSVPRILSTNDISIIERLALFPPTGTDFLREES